MSTLRRIEDCYPRLVAALPATSAGRNTDNAAGYAPAPDPRRAPLRVEVSDLIAEIEDTVTTLASHVCSVLDLPSWSPNHPGRRAGVDAGTMAALHTLGCHWRALEEALPGMAEAAENRLGVLVAKARRLLGEAPPPPAPLVSPCPTCGEPAIFRVETEAGVVAACSACGGRWDEVEWEDAHAVGA